MKKLLSWLLDVLSAPVWPCNTVHTTHRSRPTAAT